MAQKSRESPPPQQAPRPCLCIPSHPLTLWGAPASAVDQRPCEHAAPLLQGICGAFCWLLAPLLQGSWQARGTLEPGLQYREKTKSAPAKNVARHFEVDLPGILHHFCKAQQSQGSNQQRKLTYKH
eukprot:1155987-Pelagomonas_calceolata.AAC.3